ncbi:MAG: dihydroflavonol-4-reductase [Sphingobacteriales bacterium]|jgi:dihydroflavonol-4-reductase
MILVTGGTGFLGSRLIYKLIKGGKVVRALKRKSGKIPPFLDSIPKDQLEWVEGDVLKIDSIRKALENITQVYHCAAMVSFNPSKYERMMKVNVEGTANLVNISIDKGIKKFVHVSSVAALGRKKDGEKITEDATWSNSKLNSGYAISKFISETEVWRGREEGLKAVIVNPSVILGPTHDWSNGSAALFKTAHKGMKFFTKGINGMVDVEDVASVMILAMDSEIEGQRYILNGENVPFAHFFKQCAIHFNRKPPHILVRKWMGSLIWRIDKIRTIFSGAEPMFTKETVRASRNRSFYVNEKVKKAFDFEFTPMDKTIQSTCQAYLHQHKA